MMNNYRIEKADTGSKYEGLRRLWCRVFGDGPEFVDALYEAFGDGITGYVVLSDEGRVVSALTCFPAGIMHVPAGSTADYHDDLQDLDGMPVYVSYAICTDPEYRGQGLAARLTDHVRRVVTTARGKTAGLEDGAPAETGLGGISLVSPAEESLISFYAALGYSEGFFVEERVIESGDTAMDEEEDPAGDGYMYGKSANERTWGISSSGMAGFLDGEDEADFTPAQPASDIQSADPSVYNMYREAFLADVPHVTLSAEMMEYLRADSDGGAGLYVMNRGDAVFRVAYRDSGSGCDETEGAERGCRVMIDELLVNPGLKAFSEEIDEEIAAQLAEHFGAETLVFRTPGFARCQSMYSAGDYDGPESDSGVQESRQIRDGYFGFPMD